MSDRDLLIEKFAQMVESGYTLSEDAISAHTIDLIQLLSQAPNMAETLQQIHVELQSLLNATSIDSTPASVAEQLRALKAGSERVLLH